MNAGSPTPVPSERASLVLSTRVLWACLTVATVLDVMGVFTGLGFDPSFQLEAQPLFFLGVLAIVLLVVRGGRVGPLLAGVIFWIPIVFLGYQLVILRETVPFGGDLVGIGELVVAIVGVLAAHNVYHKLKGGWFGNWSRAGPGG